MAEPRAPAGERRPLPETVWRYTARPARELPPLVGSASADVAVIGAGFSGASAAIALAEAGFDVVVIDATEPGWGASGRNNGQVIAGMKLDPDAIEAHYGAARGARVTAWAGGAPGAVFDLIARHAIDCHAIHRGWIQPAYTRRAVAAIESRCAQWAARGADVEWIPPERLPAMLGTDQFFAAWLDRRGGSVNPLGYARGLVDAAIGAGARVHADTPAVTLGREGSAWKITTPLATLRAPKVFVATGAYGEDLVHGLSRTFVPVRTAQVATEPLPEALRQRILPGGQPASDTRRLLTSFRLSPDARLVMGGAAATGSLDHDALLPYLHRAGAELFGSDPPLPWSHGWSGYFAVTSDHLPHLHESGDGLICALGCNGRGIALSTAMGQLVARRIQGAAAADLELGPTPMKKVIFHQFSDLGIGLATRFKRLQDTLDRRADRPVAIAGRHVQPSH